MTGKRFDILIVCHANLCRSPIGERLMCRAIHDRLGPGGDAFRVSSAGTHAWSNQAMHPLAAEVLAESGTDTSGFRSRRLTADLVAAADLVLTATRRQRSACVAFEPAAVRHTFTIRQFGRYAAAMPTYSPMSAWPPQERLRNLIEQLSLVRGTLPVAAVEQDDLADPVGRPIQAFRRCAAEIEQVIGVMAALIAPTPRAGPASNQIPAGFR
jgi:protein-tyrosine phosphatase